ncbi:MAG: hypothetical protein AB8F74_21460 [Saprospiraceae bacterium]
MKFNLCLIFILFLQDVSAQTSSFEFQAAVGINTLQPKGTREALENYNPDVYNEDIKQLYYEGFNFELGFLGNRNLNKSFYLRSGLQFHYLQSEIDYRTDFTDVNFPDRIFETNQRKVTTTIRGFQIPVLFGYRKPFGKWEAFVEVGFSLSYAPVKIKRAFDITTFYDYGNVYVDSCQCFMIIEPQEKLLPTKESYENDDKLKNFEARGIFGIGALLHQKKGKTLRLAYRMSGSIHPLEDGNRDRNKLYRPFEVYTGTRHLIHQLELAWGWPSRKSPMTEDGKTIVAQKGVFLGTGISLFRPFEIGTGWGRNIHLQYISPLGFGARLEAARLVAPSSYYGITARFYKIQGLYQMNNGIQFHGGWSTGTGGDGDGSGYKGGGIHAGVGAVAQLNRFLGVQFQLTEHYFYQEFGSDFMLEGGVGVLFRLWK